MTGSAKLYADPDKNTTKAVGANGGDPIVLGNTADDYLLASTSTFESGFGIFQNQTGAFDLFFNNFLLTTGDNNRFGGLNNPAPGNQNGDLFFTSPRPFHTRINLDGDFNQPSSLPGPAQTLRGDVSIVFEVPEPGSLALVGLALTGLGLSQRRKKLVK